MIFFMGGTNRRFSGIFWDRDTFAFIAFLQRSYHGRYFLLCAGHGTWEERFFTFFVLGILKAWLVMVVIFCKGAGFLSSTGWGGGCLADWGNEN